MCSGKAEDARSDDPKGELGTRNDVAQAIAVDEDVAPRIPGELACVAAGDGIDRACVQVAARCVLGVELARDAVDRADHQGLGPRYFSQLFE